MRLLRRPADAPVLITEARMSAEQEFNNRRRRYLVMMAGRALCVIGAVVFYNVSVWLAAALLIGAAVLPWSAVLLANDGPAKQAVRFRRFLPTGEASHPELESGAHAPPRRDPPETIDL